MRLLTTRKCKVSNKTQYKGKRDQNLQWCQTLCQHAVKHISVCVYVGTLIHIELSVKHQLFLWCWFSKNLMSFSERAVAAQSTSAVLNLSCFPTYKPSLQSKEHNVQFFNGSRPRHSGSLLCALPQCKHLIKIACASTIAAKCNSRTTSLWSPPSKGRFSSLG